jgi:hypothetical protein
MYLRSAVLMREGLSLKMYAGLRDLLAWVGSFAAVLVR